VCAGCSRRRRATCCVCQLCEEDYGIGSVDAERELSLRQVRDDRNGRNLLPRGVGRPDYEQVHRGAIIRPGPGGDELSLTPSSTRSGIATSYVKTAS
jgi:hypothetical protein